MRRNKVNDKLSEDKPQKELLKLSHSEWVWPLAFMLSMTMTGLNFPLGYLFIPLILFNRFRNDRYDFIIMFTLFAGGYSLITSADLHFDVNRIVLIISLIGLFIYKKPPILKKQVAAFAIYTAILFTFALLSDEIMSVQIYEIVYYLSIAYFIIPLLAFSGRDFDIKVFYRRLFPYALIFCIYYFLDSVILNGHVFMPRDISGVKYEIIPTFYNLRIEPFAMKFPRLWPLGLYILVLCIVPVVKHYKLQKWHWLAILTALAISRTFTFTIGIIVVYFLAQANFKRIMKYGMIGLVALVALYFIDGLLPTHTTEETNIKQSTLRVKSQIDQIIFINEIEDEEELANLGTGRMAQIIPKFELLYSMDREWIGLGFLSRTMTTQKKFIIENELYKNPDEEVEVAIGVEVVPLQIILSIGYLGLILHILYYFYTWWAIRKLKHASFYLCTIVAFSILGIAGISGLIRPHGLYLAGLALGVVILANKRELGGFSLPPEEKKSNYEQR